MKWTRVGVFICVALTIAWSLVFVSGARADEATVVLKERRIFYLDWGFVGRSVSLDLNGGKTVVSWEAGDLTAPTILMVEIEIAATSSVNGAELDDEVVHLTWADPYHLSARGVKITNDIGCAASAWMSCALFKQEGGSWKETADSRAYGHARVRMGMKKSAYMTQGAASWYAYKNCRCAASPDFPKGTRVRVRSLLTGKYTVVRINDWGPERDKFPERVIDLDAVAFKEFAPLGAGVIKVTVEPIDSTDPDYAMADSLPPAQIAQTTTVTTQTIPAAASPTPTWSY